MRSRTFTLLLVPTLVLTACGGGSGGDTTTTGAVGQEETTTTSAEPDASTSAPAATSTTSSEMTDGIHTEDSEFGEIVVDPDGFTLYIFTADSAGESTCYEACADLWPPIAADTPISSDVDASMFGSVSRTDGSEQLTVNGMPLYRYAPDAIPGDVTGQGFNDVWFVVDGSGTVVEATAPVGGDDGYDY
jgi:predicted lipoprotein with Yx(FWY)xxD motif